jgi:hypothetical protein
MLRHILARQRRPESLLPPLKDIALEYQEENEFACLIEEYKALRTEIVTRLEAQQDVLSYSIVLIAAALPVSGTVVEREQYTLLLLIPLVFILIGWLLLSQEYMIDTLGVYINTRLAPRMECLLARKMQTRGPLWEWELFQYSTFYGASLGRLLQAILGTARYVLPVLPGIASIIAYLQLFRSREFHIGSIDTTLLLIDIAAMICLVTMAALLKSPKLKALRARTQKAIN